MVYYTYVEWSFVMNEEEKLNSEDEETGKATNNGESAGNSENSNADEGNWKFDAKAPMLENNIELGDGFQIDVEQQAPVVRKKDELKAVNKKEHIVINRKALRIGVLSAVSAVLAALLIFFGVRFFAFPNSSERMNPGNVALTVGNTKVSVGMYNLYYNMVVSNYKQYAQQGYIDIDFSKDLSDQLTVDENGNKISWEEVFKLDTIMQLQQVMAYYEPAAEAGVTLSDDQKESVESNIDSLKQAASEAGSKLNDFIEANYGKYCGVETIKKFLEQRALFENYYYQKNLDISLPFADLEKYYEENKDNYVTFAMLETQFSLNDTDLKTIDDVKAKAQEYCDRINSLKDLKDLIPELCSSLAEQAVENGYFSDKASALKSMTDNAEITYNTDVLESNYGTEIVDWFKSPDRADGDTTYFVNEDYGMITIFLNTSEAKPDETELYSVRHILISPNDDPETAETATEEEWNSALEKANKIVEEYNSSDKTELSFSELAEKYSIDTNSIIKGQAGKYGGIVAKTSLGVMVPEFEGWATDDARQYGDVEIVKSKYGYHIMYFIYDGPTYLFNVMDDANNEKRQEYIKSVEYKEHKAFKQTTVVEPVSNSVN